MGRCRRPILNREIHDQKNYTSCLPHSRTRAFCCLLTHATHLVAHRRVPLLDRDASRLDPSTNSDHGGPFARCVQYCRFTVLNVRVHAIQRAAVGLGAYLPFPVPNFRLGCGLVTCLIVIVEHASANNALTASLVEPVVDSFTCLAINGALATSLRFSSDPVIMQLRFTTI